MSSTLGSSSRTRAWSSGGTINKRQMPRLRQVSQSRPPCEAGPYRVPRDERGKNTEREEEKAGQIEPEDQDDDHESQ